jgi:hypothetical protein
MSTTESAAGIKKINEISPTFNDIKLTTSVFDDLKSLLPVNVYYDSTYKYEMSQFSFDSIALNYTNSLNVDAIADNSVATDLARENFTSFNGFPNAQKLIQFGYAIEDLKRNPTLNFDDSIFINTFNTKIQDLVLPLNNTIYTFKYIGDDGTTKVVVKLDDVKDITYDSEITESIAKMDLLIKKYADTTIWMLYNAVKYMELIDGGLKMNYKRGSLITPLDYVTAASLQNPELRDSFDMFTYLVSPSAEADRIDGVKAPTTAPTGAL